jgi:radical SAM protein (TIGR01212 family)
MNFITKEKPYNTLNEYFRQIYGSKVFKVSLNAGFTCPNKDGSVATGGCTFCSVSGSGDFAGAVEDPLDVQFNTIKEMMHEKWPEGKYIAYFQAGTNTHAPLEVLKKTFEPVLEFDKNIVGISIGTRCDSLGEDIVEYLGELSKKTDLYVEIGLQTIHEKTSKEINRAHSLECVTEAVKRLKQHNIHVIVHIINGLPNEDKKMMIETIEYCNSLPIDGIKIHLLHVMKKTAMGVKYLRNPFKMITLEEYVDITTHQIRLLRPDIIIHRLTGDAPRHLLIEPKWSLKKFVVMNEIDKMMRVNHYTQGDLYKKTY